jgi:hypothetical protein
MKSGYKNGVVYIDYACPAYTLESEAETRQHEHPF